MHVLPQLRKLERRFPDELVVVGVHSPKFTGEHDTENVRQACLRLGIDHPVVNDPQMRMWSEYAVQAWPTLMFVDPAGKVVGKSEGEVHADELEPVLASMIQEYDAKGILSRKPLQFQPEEPPGTPLLFPCKVIGDATSGRLYIADSGHHRIVVAGTDGQTSMVIGTGEPVLRDGGPDEAGFNLPQGLALGGDTLYVADTWNHAVRRVDLPTGRVETIAGTGQLGRRVKDGPGLTTDLRSPWGLLFHGGTLYVAMAGTHNLWTLDPRSGELAKYSGTGREALTDGPLHRATFAQPSGLSTDGRVIFVADSETSAVRTVDLPGAGDQVHTLVGEGLFVFGDADGRGGEVRLQHALDVAFDSSTGMLYVADAYNSKIKRMDPRSGQTVSLLGDGSHGWKDGFGTSASFWEPGGLSVLDGKLYVADTNNHAIRVVDLATMEVSTLEFPTLSVPSAAGEGGT